MGNGPSSIQFTGSAGQSPVGWSLEGLSGSPHMQLDKEMTANNELTMIFWFLQTHFGVKS